MNILGESIATFRKRNNITQVILAEYLGVSPQAVSAWEKDNSAPDVYMLPKIAMFFGITIDELFGISGYENAKLLVSKYFVDRNDRNYKEAMKALEIFLHQNPQDMKAVLMKSQLEYERSKEYLQRCTALCEKVQNVAINNDIDLYRKATIQKIHAEHMLDNKENIEKYRIQFQKEKTKDNFNYLLIALDGDYNQILALGNEYIGCFTYDEQVEIYPNLMNAAYFLGNMEIVEQCFLVITHGTQDLHQIFNAWWLRWLTAKKTGHVDIINKSYLKLQELLEGLPSNEYQKEGIRRMMEQ